MAIAAVEPQGIHAAFSRLRRKRVLTGNGLCMGSKIRVGSIPTDCLILRNNMKDFISRIKEGLTCRLCNNSGIIECGFGGMTQSCKKFKCRTMVFSKDINKIIFFFKKYSLPLLFSGFILLTILFYLDNQSTPSYKSSPTGWITFAISWIALIFAALKYKLDRATFQKNLFEERYKLFSIIDEVMWDFAFKGTVTKEMTSKMTLDLMRKSYFLFNKNTYSFIENFRQALINVEHLEETHSDDPKVKNARKFLASVVDRQNLTKNFEELKISEY
jgi:hypothetical protein